MGLNGYIWDNFCYLKEFLQSELPQVRVARLEGTYLAWLDINALELTSDEGCRRRRNCSNEGKVLLSSGTLYGRRAGQGYLRLNLVCPRTNLKQALIRIGRAEPICLRWRCLFLPDVTKDRSSCF